ncbi:hypothetical protein DEAC_c44390 [Desulfosporosinus acididurans]|uniref:Uncharacterized protein n=1 Tax=Desulfosporosinus acididurans TaxID=476652 RepID=A0A0J1FJQ7_9FIRM|nr:hypothetical protein DEAC_c44390 [Desulfosporosinus acididurans]
MVNEKNKHKRSRKHNQKMSQWHFGRTITYLNYKLAIQHKHVLFVGEERKSPLEITGVLVDIENIGIYTEPRIS